MILTVLNLMCGYDGYGGTSKSFAAATAVHSLRSCLAVYLNAACKWSQTVLRASSLHDVAHFSGPSLSLPGSFLAPPNSCWFLSSFFYASSPLVSHSSPDLLRFCRCCQFSACFFPSHVLPVSSSQVLARSCCFLTRSPLLLPCSFPMLPWSIAFPPWSFPDPDGSFPALSCLAASGRLAPSLFSPASSLLPHCSSVFPHCSACPLCLSLLLTLSLIHI